MSHLIQIFEYEALRASDKTYFPDEEIGKKVIDKLWQYNDANKNIYFEAIRNGIKFKQYVGVIQIGNITIEILPKTDKNKSTVSDKQNWHNVLLKMLAKCKRIRVDSVSKASLKKRYHTLLDLYFRMYLDEVNYLLEQGLVKKYHKKSGNLNALKGRIEFARNIRHNLIHKERFHTLHQVYDNNHIINQILYKGLLVLKSITNDCGLTDNINRILSRFPEVDDRIITKSHFDSLIISRKTTQYQEALKIAEMIILNYSPDIKGGNENMIALLFDMNKLWEEYVYVMLARASEAPTTVHFQNQKPFWNKKIIKPDIVIKNLKGKDYVIDTKWKMIDPKYPSDDDLKQMYTYNMYWEVDLSMLLYPFCGFTESVSGIYHSGYIKRKVEEDVEKDFKTNCQVASIAVVDIANNLNLNIGKDILNLLAIPINEKIK